MNGSRAKPLTPLCQKTDGGEMLSSEKTGVRFALHYRGVNAQLSYFGEKENLTIPTADVHENFTFSFTTVENALLMGSLKYIFGGFPGLGQEEHKMSQFVQKIKWIGLNL